MTRRSRFPLLSHLRIVLFITVQYTSALNDTRLCYNVNNEIMSEHHPCVAPETKAISHCCSSVDICLGDTLCLSQWGTLYVGSCTVKDWVDGRSGRGDCPKYCRTWSIDGVGQDIGVCNYTDGAWEFCCGALAGIDGCCNGDRFNIQNTTNQYLIQRPWMRNDVDIPASSSSISSATSPANTSGPATTNTSPINTSPASTAQCKPPGNATDTKTPKIGMAAGLGVPLLMALGMLVRENRKRRQAEAKLAPAVMEEVEQADYAQGMAYEQGSAWYQQRFEAPEHTVSEMPSSTKPKPLHELGIDQAGK